MFTLILRYDTVWFNCLNVCIWYFKSDASMIVNELLFDKVIVEFDFVGLAVRVDLDHWIVLSGFDLITHPSKTVWPKFCVTDFLIAFTDGKSYFKLHPNFINLKSYSRANSKKTYNK